MENLAIKKILKDKKNLTSLYIFGYLLEPKYKNLATWFFLIEKSWRCKKNKSLKLWQKFPKFHNSEKFCTVKKPSTLPICELEILSSNYNNLVFWEFYYTIFLLVYDKWYTSPTLVCINVGCLCNSNLESHFRFIKV